ncbi:unnamed protein product, partial [Symbiodinium microadriaticum]
EENSNLRLAVEDLTASFEEFQATMTKSLLDQQKQLKEKQTHVPNDDSTVFTSDELQLDSMSCLEQARYVEQRLDATSALLADAVNPNPSRNGATNTPRSVRKGPRFGTPLRDGTTPLSTLGTASARGLGTPAARPLNWLVQQANSEVKGLRVRAEKLRWNIPEDNSGEGFVDKENMGANELNSPPPPVRQTGPYTRNKSAADTVQVRNLQTQLEESLRIIYEMDRLVHAALVGNLGAGQGAGGSTRTSLEYTEEEEDGNDADVEFDAGHS